MKDVEATPIGPAAPFFASMSPRSLLLALPLVVACCAALPACQGSSVSNSGAGQVSEDAGGQSFGPVAGDAGEPEPDSAVEGAAAAVATYQGSPLCNASPATSCCYPDALSVCAPTACEAPSDAGIVDGPGGYAYTQVFFGCHVAPATSTSGDAATTSAPSVPQVAPACLPAGLGLDGAPCRAPDDCAPGYECVGSNGTCRHYCCAGNSACKPDLQFCDIQQTAQATPMNVPVCMPIKPCALLRDACPSGETCAVVREDGSTSCVAVGDASVGDSCETDHCKAGLVCLGAPGSHRCYALCEMSQSSQCPSTQTCKGGLPLFIDPGIGVCE